MTLSRRSPPERSRGSATRFDTTRQTVVFAALAVLLFVIIAALAFLLISAVNPAFFLNITGGASRARDVSPRNTDIWIVYPDGSLRFVTYFVPGVAEAASVVFTVAGPYVNAPEDVISAETIGALYTGEEVQSGVGNDAARFFTLYSMERDPSLDAYGVDVLTANPPYISADTTDPQASVISMGAEPQVSSERPQPYYQQVIIALGFPPGTQVLDIAYQLQTETPVLPRDVMLYPSRRVTINGWIIYYFDGTSLDVLNTIRMRYIIGGETPEFDPLEIDARR